jgi:lipid II:glycine glycyltransferase (peptidoglycan interpeptide bridge formation enzyme)
MPEIYRCYFAEIEAEIVAAAIVVEISRESLYVLYWGDTPGYWRKTSPVVAIFMEVYKDAYQEGFKYLDLGISSVDGEINPGLTRFKRNLGCIDSEKIKVLFYNPDSRA